MTQRHCDPVTMDHLIDLRKRMALLEKQLENTLSWVTPLRRENERLQNTSHLLYEAGLKKDNEIERLGEVVLEIVYQIGQGNTVAAMDIAAPIAAAALQQKERE